MTALALKPADRVKWLADHGITGPRKAPAYDDFDRHAWLTHLELELRGLVAKNRINAMRKPKHSRWAPYRKSWGAT